MTAPTKGAWQAHAGHLKTTTDERSIRRFEKMSESEPSAHSGRRRAVDEALRTRWRSQPKLPGAWFERAPAKMSESARLRSRAAVLQRRAAGVARRGRRAEWIEATTQEAGLYYLTAEQLAGSAGLAPGAVQGLVRARQLMLTHRGQPVSYLPTPTGQASSSTPSLSRASTPPRTSTSWALVGDRRWHTSGPAHGRCCDVLPGDAAREEEVFSAPTAILDPDSDFWFWQYLYAGYDGLDTASVTVPPWTSPGTGAAALTVYVAGGYDRRRGGRPSRHLVVERQAGGRSLVGRHRRPRDRDRAVGRR